MNQKTTNNKKRITKKSVTNKMIQEAAKKMGFSLEFQVFDILEKFPGGSLKSNYHISDVEFTFGVDGSKQNCEIDALFSFSNHNDDFLFFIECKGGKSNDVLMLIKDGANKHADYYDIYMTSNEIGFNEASNRIVNSKNGLTVCHTGDFFEIKQTELKKTGGNNGKLFDGVNNLLKSIANYYEFETKGQHRELTIYPVIVTNTEISIVKFKDDKEYCIDNPLIERNIRWALYKNEKDFKFGKISRNSFYSWGQRKPLTGQPRLLPYIWVVNINHLKEFMESQNKTY